MNKTIKPFSTTGIGSLPHKISLDAAELVLKSVDIPFWPQLPNLSFKESMITQFSEGMPFVRVNEAEKNIVVIRDASDQLERFYEAYSESTKIAISEDYAKGLHTFIKIIKKRRFEFLKGHVTGPLTFTLSLKDNYGRPIFFDEELREISTMLLKAKARWQIELLRQHADNVIIFIDEPILSAIGGSAYLGVDPDETLRLLREMVKAVQTAGGIAGIHCCGKADWALVLKSGVSILSFDAYDYSESLAIYHKEVKDFLKAGNYLSWGIVPTSEIIQHLEERQIISLMNNAMEGFYNNISPELIKSRVLLTPACGTASRTIGESTKIFQLLMRLKESFES